MSLDFETLWHERFENIGSLISENAELLTAQWCARVQAESEKADSVYYLHLRDRLPELLAAMGRSLAESTTVVPPPHALLALEHGEQRWQIGWQLSEVVQDYQILRLVLVEFLDAQLDQPLRTREIMAVGLALDDAISASVLAYVGHQEQQLRDANRRLADFLPVLGHELRNPLAAITGAMEIVHLCKVEDAELGNAHQIINRQLEQITRLVNDMVDVSRITHGKLELRATLTDARETIQQSVESIRPLVDERGHMLSVSLPNDPLVVLADPLRLRQVFTNLLHNAAKYTPARGKIRVEAQLQEGQIFVLIRDSGIGISNELLPHVFDMFYQGRDSKQQGLGIGLSLVRALVELHGGTILAASAGTGQGSEFIVKLPLANAKMIPNVATAAHNQQDQPHRCLQVLVVDDHADSAHTFKELLKRAGHDVHVAADGNAALQKLDSFVPGVIFIDIGLPGMNGYELAQRLRHDQRFQATSLVAITGYTSEDDQQRARDAGFDAYLAKPVNIQAVQAVLSTLGPRP